MLLLACLGFAYVRGRTAWRGANRLANGVEYDAQTYKGRLNGVTVGVATRAAVEFEIKPEGALDRFAKRIGLSVEGEVGQGRFDDRLYLVSDDPHVLTGLRFDPELPEALLALFDARPSPATGVTRLVCRGGKVRLQVGARGLPEDAAALVGDYAPGLRAVAARLDASAGPRRPDPLWWRATVLLGIASGLAANGALQALRVGWSGVPNTLDDGQLAFLGLLVAAIVMVGLVAATWTWLGRTSRAHLVLAQVLALGGPGAYATAVTEVRDYNMDADTSVAATYPTVVADARVSRSRRSTTYYVTFAAWPGSGGAQEIKVPYDRFPAVGTPVRVRVHDGALGMRWLEAWEVGDDASR